MDDIHPLSVFSLVSLSLSSPKRILAEATAIATMASSAMSLPLQPCCKVHTPTRAPVSNPSRLSSEVSKPSVAIFRRVLAVNSQRIRRRRPVSVRCGAEEVTKPNEVTQAKGLSLKTGGQWLSSTTRHVRIYAGYVDPVTKIMDQSQLDKLTLMLDPDNEFVWPEERVQQVYSRYKELVDNYAVSGFEAFMMNFVFNSVWLLDHRYRIWL